MPSFSVTQKSLSFCLKFQHVEQALKGGDKSDENNDVEHDVVMMADFDTPPLHIKRQFIFLCSSLCRALRPLAVGQMADDTEG